MDISTDTIRWIFVDLFILLISIALHEFGHAYMADRLGDDTPRRQGRVTLNPLAHADPIGTFLLPLIGNLHAAAGGHGGGFGWGKPVQWNPSRIRRGIRMSTANILVSFAGPFMNLALATVLALVHTILRAAGVVDGAALTVLDPDAIFYVAVTTNFVLFFFNLLPVPPLDGGHITRAFMPYRHRETFDNVAKYGPFIVMGVAFIPPINKVFLVPAGWCAEHLYKGLGSLFGL
ncbi:MAG: peptidase [Deltaproteobacteria bacterium]|nr:peptidase [Deltaproteobacteria bacterium]